jgi:tetratricopeptide (TPR) repeat protein
MESDAEMERWEQIEAYLDGEMGEEERQTFEERLRQDDGLAQALERARIGRLAVRQYGLRNTLQSVHAQAMAARQPVEMQTAAAPSVADVPVPPARVRPLWHYASRLAASVVILLVAFAAFQFFTLSADLLTQGREMYVAQTSRGGEADEIRAQLQTAYAQGDYQKFIQLYESQPAVSGTEQNETNLMAGNAYLALNQPQKAAACFRQIQVANAASAEKPFEEDAEYYLALSLLKQNRIAEAQLLFAQIRQDSEHPYHSQVSWWWMQQLQWLKWKE